MLRLTNDQKKTVNELVRLLEMLPEAMPDLEEGFFIIEDESKTDEFNTFQANKAQLVIDYALEQARINLELVNKMLEEN